MALSAAAFALGIGLAWWLRPSAFLVWAGAAGAAAVLRQVWQRPKAANLALLSLILSAGVLRAVVDSQEPAHCIAAVLTSVPRPITCEGTLVSDVDWTKPPRGQAFQQGWMRLTCVREADESVPVCGRLLVRFPARELGLSYGDRVRLHGEVRGFQDDRKRNRQSQWFWLQGASGVLMVSTPEGIVRLGASPNPWIRYRRWVDSFRKDLRQLGRSCVGPLEAAYLEALLLGESAVPKDLQEAYRRTGTIHVLVVSGFHVVLIGSIGLLVLSLLRVPRNLRYLSVTVLSLTYCLLTGAKPPILRATVMGILVFLGSIPGLPGSALNGLGLSALVILGWNPRALADAGFQLSFAAVLGILELSPRISRWISVLLPPSEAAEGAAGRQALGRRLGQGLAVSLGAWTATFPIVAWHFHMVTPLAVLANLLVVPWASLLMVTGLLLYAVGMIDPSAAAPCAAVFSACAQGLSRLVTWMAALPGGCWRW